MARRGELQRRVEAHLREKSGGAANCPICQEARWAAKDEVVAPKVTAEAEIDARTVTPMVQVVCNNCGYIMNFHANVILD